MTARHRYLIAALLSAAVASCTLYTSHDQGPLNCGGGSCLPDAAMGSGSGSGYDGGNGCGSGLCYPDAGTSGGSDGGGGGGSDGGCGGGSDGGYGSGIDGGGCGGGICYPDAAVVFDGGGCC